MHSKFSDFGNGERRFKCTTGKPLPPIGFLSKKFRHLE